MFKCLHNIKPCKDDHHNLKKNFFAISGIFALLLVSSLWSVRMMWKENIWWRHRKDFFGCCKRTVLLIYDERGRERVKVHSNSNNNNSNNNSNNVWQIVANIKTKLHLIPLPGTNKIHDSCTQCNADFYVEKWNHILN